MLPLTSPASTTDVSRVLLATPRQADGGFVVLITMMMIPRVLLAGLVDSPYALLATSQQAASSFGCVVRPRALLATLHFQPYSSMYSSSSCLIVACVETKHNSPRSGEVPMIDIAC